MSLDVDLLLKYTMFDGSCDLGYYAVSTVLYASYCINILDKEELWYLSQAGQTKYSRQR